MGSRRKHWHHGTSGRLICILQSMCSSWDDASVFEYGKRKYVFPNIFSTYGVVPWSILLDVCAERFGKVYVVNSRNKVVVTGKRNLMRYLNVMGITWFRNPIYHPPRDRTSRRRGNWRFVFVRKVIHTSNRWKQYK